jgi:putative DNA primase/helicase
MVYPDTSPEWRNVDRWPDTAAKQAAFDVIGTLAQLEPECVGATELVPGEPAHLRFTPEAQERFDQWRAGLERTLRIDDEHPVIVSHLAKYRSLMPSLALLLHLADSVSRGHGGPVTLHAAERAISWCRYLEAHARRIYHPVIARRRVAAGLLGAKIRAGRLCNPFVARDVTEADWSGLTEPDDVRQAIELLLERNWFRAVPDQPSSTGGRPTVRYHINPKLHCMPPSKPAKPPVGRVLQVLRATDQDDFGRSDGGGGPLREEWIE